MAITKIHAIQATVNKAVDYICNPAKTDESILISSFGCSPQTAAYDFKFALSKTNQSDPNKAYHLIQAFMPGEVSYEEAHRIGEELADKLLEGKYSYVVATHIDKGHVHNHIIFCAADNINHEKYHDCKKSYYHIRKLSDELCEGHHLSVILPDGQRGKSYKEWQTDKNNLSWKSRLKTDIDESIKQAQSYEQFLELLSAKGYEIKGESFGENSLKYISFRSLDRKQFVRGSVKSLGANYTKESIRERIEHKSSEQLKIALPARKRTLIKDYSRQKLIDTSDEKFADSPGLKQWATVENLKIAASSYSQSGSISELEQEIAFKNDIVKNARKSLIESEHQLKDLGQILKYAEQYKANRIYHIRYRKSKNPDAYLQRHETELLLHDGAKNMLQRMGIDIKKLDLDALRNEYNLLYAKKQKLQQTYKSTEKEIASLQRKLDNLNQYLDRNQSSKSIASKSKENKQTSL